VRNRWLTRALLYAGTVSAVVGLAKVHAVRHVYDYSGSSRFAWSMSYILMLAVASYAAGLPDLVRDARAASGAALAALTSSALGVSAVQLFVGDELLPRFVVFGAVVLLLPWYVLCAAIAAGGRARAERRDRVVVVGSADEAELLAMELRDRAEHPAQVVAVVAPQSETFSPSITESIRSAVENEHASVLVLTNEALADEGIVHGAAELHVSGIRVRTLSAFYDQWLGKLPVSELARMSLMFDIGEVHRASYARLTRVIDLGIAVFGVACLVLVVPFVAIGNRIANRGPLFYRQTRTGKNGRPFEIWKFRTMRPDADLANEWTIENDPRITSFGHLLRVAHIDELPQMYNILRGDLSVVGPRPEQPHYVAELTTKLPFYDLRHLVRPGLTGWAQVKYGYAGSESDALEKLQYEFWYLQHQSLILDARIIGRTIRSVVGRSGR
jgi:exopolysaccharide biosynthesis polyprenyl glycosylphosphotransferase